MGKVIVVGILSLLFYVGTVEGTCGLLDDIPYGMRIPSDQPTTIPFWEGSAFGVAIVALRTQRNYCPFTAKISGTGENQTVSLFTKEEYKNVWDDWRDIYIRCYLWLRCSDGSKITEDKYIHVEALDDTPSAPYFASLNYTYSVSLPWPETIPITHEWPIWVRDRDYNVSMAQVTFSVDMPSILTVRSTNYSDYSVESYDFKVDLYLNQQTQIVPGTYQIVLTADDNFNVTTVPVYLQINEAECKATSQSPNFGKVDSPVNFYKGIVSSIPVAGDILDLNGQTIQAYHPDPLCTIDLSVDSDFLEINSKAEIVFSRSLSLEELEKLDSPYVILITATQTITGTMHQVPLIICIEIPEVVSKPKILSYEDN